MQHTNRSAGVLLHITSLPGPFGSGRFGTEAVDFARLAWSCGFSAWQVLPFGPPAAGDSPYQCFSAFAGNPLFIDPRQLAELELLSQNEIHILSLNQNMHACDYSRIDPLNSQMLQNAFRRVTSEQMDQIRQWAVSPEQACWLPDYALFMAIRQHNQKIEWWEWPDLSLRRHEHSALSAFADTYRAEIDFFFFEQFHFDKQWQKIKTQINQIGLRIIGDMPIYVARDSADVWANHSYFQLDDQLEPEAVAGVPPDYFAEDGQLWGNPLYDWPVHDADGYTWWLNRLARAFHQFDAVRLDHFRGFVDYWSVPAGAKTARFGTWIRGPGHHLFSAIFARFPDAPIIAEDLGEIDDEVRQFLRQTDLPGMRVMQFGFDQSPNNLHLPCFYPAHCVAYSGTHDNNTLLGWIWEMTPAERRFVMRYTGQEYSEADWGRGGVHAPLIRSILRVLWASSADQVIVPLQDLLGYGSDTRMNTPGLATGQWRFRITETALNMIDRQWLYELSQVYQRLPIEADISDIRPLPDHLEAEGQSDQTNSL